MDDNIVLKDQVFKRKKMRLFATTIVPSQMNFYRHHNHDSSPEKISDLEFRKEISTPYQIIDNLKLDINNIQNIINENCDVIPFYKNPRSEKKYEKLVKKIKEIEVSKDINTSEFFNFLKNTGSNNVQLMINYTCKDQNELIMKLYQEAKLSDFLLRRIKDLSILICLKYTNLENKLENQYQETNSKITTFITLIESMIQKLQGQVTGLEKKVTRKGYSNLQVNLCEVFEIANSKEFQNSSFFFDASNRLEFDEFAENENAKENNYKNNENQKTIRNETWKYGSNEKTIKDQTINQIDRKASIKRKLVLNSDSSEEFEDNNNFPQKELEIIQKFENQNDEIKEKNETINHLRSVIDEYNKMLSVNKANDEKRKLLLLDQIKELTKKNEKIEEKLRTIRNEYELLKKNYISIETNLKKGHLEYETVLKDEIELMKAAYFRRIDDLSSNIGELKGENYKKLIVIEDELKKITLQKDYFMNQVKENKKN